MWIVILDTCWTNAWTYARKVDDAIGILCLCAELEHGALEFCIEFISQACLVTYVFVRCESSSSASRTTNAHRSFRIRDRSRLQRCGCLVSQGKGMFAGVVRNVKENDLCRGIDCRFSDEYIGEKADAVGYCLWCDSDTMQKIMESKFLRNSHVKKALQFFMTMMMMYFVWRLHDCLCSVVLIGH